MRSTSKLTERTIAALPAPDPSGRPKLHFDSELRGFAVLCSGVTNGKTYIAQRTLPSGTTRRVTVGAVGAVALAVARRRAADLLDQMRRGVDPKERRHGSATLRETLESYLSARKDLRPASVRLYRLSVEQYLTAWLDLPLATISADMVESRHRSIVDEITARGERYKGGTMANVALRVLGILWSFAAERTPGLPENPVRRLRRQWYPDRRRERMVLSDDMPKFYAAVDALENKVAGDFIKLLLFSGLRRTEAATLQWTDVDFAARVIRVPSARTKTNRKLDLPMSDFVFDLLVARRALGDAKFIFPSPSKAGYLAEPNYALVLVAKACGIRVSAHDLRRTFVTVAESCDISPMALKALVNHSIGSDVTSGYVILSAARLREAGQKVCDKLKESCGIETPAGENVARLR